MARPNADYWKDRMSEVEAASHKTGIAAYKEIEEQYQEAQRGIEAQINKWYGRLAANNGVSLQEAKKMLSTRELKEFKWDVNDYIKHGRENALNQQWMKELENASARYHISRLEAMQLECQQQIEKAFGNQLDTVDAAIRKIYTDGYYRTAYEVQKGVGIGWDLSKLDTKEIDTVIHKPWAQDGTDFSDRIWSNKDALVQQCNTTLTQSIMRGQDPQKAIDAMSKKLDVSKSNAGRLVMTESAALSSRAQMDSFKELGVEEYEIVATLDSRTSEICRDMDGKHFKMSEYEVGETAPPFHPWCRSVTAPYFSDDFGSVGTRAARDDGGKTYQVPANMTYHDWEKSFIEGGEKDGLKQVDPGQQKPAAPKPEPKRQAEKVQASDFPAVFTAKKSEAKNTQALIDFVNSREGADADVIDVYRRMGQMENIESAGFDFKISHGSDNKVFTHTYFDGTLHDAGINIPKLQGDDLTGQVGTTLHEEWHLMDLYKRQETVRSGNWFSASNTDLVNTFKNTDASIGSEVQTIFDEFHKACKEIDDRLHQEYADKLKAADEVYNAERAAGVGWAEAWKKQKKAYNTAWSEYKSQSDYELRNACGGDVGALEDIYDALSGGKYRDNGTVKYGHGSSYYTNYADRIEETTANYAALSIIRPDLIKALEHDKPELAKALHENVLAMLK